MHFPSVLKTGRRRIIPDRSLAGTVCVKPLFELQRILKGAFRHLASTVGTATASRLVCATRVHFSNQQKIGLTDLVSRFVTLRSKTKC